MSSPAPSAGSAEHPTPVNGWTFTPMEQAYMREKLEGYNASSGKQRRRFLRSTTQYICQENEKRTGANLTEAEKSAIGKALRAWFKAHGNARKTEKNLYGTKWYGRRVYMRIHKAKVQALADEIVKGDGDVDLDEFLENWDSDEARESKDGGGEGGKTGRNAKTKGKTGDNSDWFFNHYQQAGTLLISTLTEKQFAKYEVLADKWNAEGPPPDVQARMADKHAAKKAYNYLKHARKDYNCLSYLLLGWMGKDGKPKAVELDVNDELGWPKNFSDDNAKLLQTVFKQFRSYVYEAFETGEDDGMEDSGKKKGHRKALMRMERNAFGEPLLPDPRTRPARVPRGDWYCQAIRTFFIYHYALVSRAKITDDSWPRFPWTRVLKEPRRFFSEAHLPDDIIETLKEPSAMTVPQRVVVFNHLYNLQEPVRKDEARKNDKLFEMKAYMDRWGNILPRKPREVFDNDGDEGDDEEEHPHPAKSTKGKEKFKGGQSKKSGKSSASKAALKSKATGGSQQREQQESSRLATPVRFSLAGASDSGDSDETSGESDSREEESSGFDDPTSRTSYPQNEEPFGQDDFQPALSPIAEDHNPSDEASAPALDSEHAPALQSTMPGSVAALEYTKTLQSFSWTSSEESDTSSSNNSPEKPALFLPDDMVRDNPLEQAPEDEDLQSPVLTRGRRLAVKDDQVSEGAVLPEKRRRGNQSEDPAPSQKRVRTAPATQTPTRRVTRAQSHTPSRGTRSATAQASRRSGVQSTTRPPQIATRGSQKSTKKAKSRARK
ncbi:hypothetical protein CC1G_12552 [Coprinopsis cinerea okayama7|uniref:Uncharacterized protein n=1 Tax=Coprinopsis cinerea (strain Okayama-7 / 130 / ATCC MYA-4618 / FGSC 9003) TaxID=240176 RepID=A8PH82_COPC7|nr:hypothetical protein CC1G_12552 [Coprinopsis cinerea okayama7\|eukprot:XP_001841354.2 hypothetical protein CC1G_12552 [Coprinopsis cinerea okayama7\